MTTELTTTKFATTTEVEHLYNIGDYVTYEYSGLVYEITGVNLSSPGINEPTYSVITTHCENSPLKVHQVDTYFTQHPAPRTVVSIKPIKGSINNMYSLSEDYVATIHYIVELSNGDVYISNYTDMSLKVGDVLEEAHRGVR
jgi:hypothetical protein